MRGSIFLKYVTYSEVSKIIMLLKNSSPGWYGVHTKVVKNKYNVFREPLLHLLIPQGVFPDELKIARGYTPRHAQTAGDFSSPCAI